MRKIIVGDFLDLGDRGRIVVIKNVIVTSRAYEVKVAW